MCIKTLWNDSPVLAAKLGTWSLPHEGYVTASWSKRASPSELGCRSANHLSWKQEMAPNSRLFSNIDLDFLFSHSSHQNLIITDSLLTQKLKPEWSIATTAPTLFTPPPPTHTQRTPTFLVDHISVCIPCSVNVYKSYTYVCFIFID